MLISVVISVFRIVLVLAQPDGEDEPQNRFRDSGFIQDVEHLRSHLKNKIKFDPDKISKDEMEFHFFKLHDLNDDNLLDGLEMMAALRHAYDHHDTATSKLREMSENSRGEHLMKYYTRTVDRILRDDDTNNDGYLTYTEYANARRAGKILERAQKEKERKETTENT